jgi:hypothetical protein
MKLLRLNWSAIAHAVKTLCVYLRGKVSGPEHAVRSGSKHLSHGFVQCHAGWFRGSPVLLGKFQEVLQGSHSALMGFEFPPSTFDRMPCLVKITS